MNARMEQLLRREITALLIGITPPGAQAILDTSSRSFTRTSGGDFRPDRDFPLFVRWYQEGKLKLDDLVTRRYPLEQINEAAQFSAVQLLLTLERSHLILNRIIRKGFCVSYLNPSVLNPIAR